MQSIKVLSLTPNVNLWLANSRQPRVLHVFEHVCNLINENKDVLSVVTQGIGDGPFNLVVEDNVVFSDYLRLESPISSCPNRLNLGDLIINTDSASLWEPRPNWEMLHASRGDMSKLLFANYQVDGLETCTAPNEAWCKSTLFATNAQGYSTTIFPPKLPLTNYCEASQWDQSQFSNSLISSLATADLASSLTATQKLAGLGAGLTPAGDDFIMGTVLAAWIIHPVDVAEVLAMEVTAVASALTTSLSGAWLRTAGRGEAGILWHQFFDDLISADQTGIQESINKILSVGETSGADALSGFVSSFAATSVKARSGHG